jgi:uncharacterized protein YoxC
MEVEFLKLVETGSPLAIIAVALYIIVPKYLASRDRISDKVFSTVDAFIKDLFEQNKKILILHERSQKNVEQMTQALDEMREAMGEITGALQHLDKKIDQKIDEINHRVDAFIKEK